jgi:glycosyltransferase involved in cell wall biosynthesis
MTSGLRFAMVTTFYPPCHFGGDGVYVRRLAHALAKRGHHVDVIHDVDAYVIGGGKNHDQTLPEPAGVTVHALRSRSPRLSTLATHQLGYPLVHGAKIRAVLERDVDVIHFHNISLVGGPGVLGYGSGVKLYTAHEHWLVCPTHILWRYGKEPCAGRECVRCVLAAKRPPQAWRSTGLLRRSAANVDAFLGLSEFSIGKHRDFGFEREMTAFPSFLPDAPASAEPASVETQQPPGKPYFLFVGRLEVIKGLDDVIPLFDAELPAELWIAGSGTHEAHLRQLAAGRPNVRFLGQKSVDELRPLYRNARALLAPSRCYEVFPLVVLEAFREGTPIIARALGPFPEIVEQTGGGLLFTDAAELRSALARLAADRELRDQMGGRGERAFVERWSETAAMTRYFDVIEGIAKQRGLKRVLDGLRESQL